MARRARNHWQGARRMEALVAKTTDPDLLPFLLASIKADDMKARRYALDVRRLRAIHRISVPDSL